MAKCMVKNNNHILTSNQFIYKKNIFFTFLDNKR